jgi:thymidylate synthase (FAD)
VYSIRVLWRLVDYLMVGSVIVQAARVSYGEGTKSFREDRGLIIVPVRNEHTSPFEQARADLPCKDADSS